jgi:uncharacterized OsmC-like protein
MRRRQPHPIAVLFAAGIGCTTMSAGAYTWLKRHTVPGPQHWLPRQAARD